MEGKCLILFIHNCRYQIHNKFLLFLRCIYDIVYKTNIIERRLTNLKHVESRQKYKSVYF